MENNDNDNVYVSITFMDVPYSEATKAVEALIALLPKKSFSVYYQDPREEEEEVYHGPAE